MTPAMILAIAGAATTLTQAAVEIIARLDKEGRAEATPEEIAALRAEYARLRELQAKADDNWIAQLAKMRDAAKNSG